MNDPITFLERTYRHYLLLGEATSDAEGRFAIVPAKEPTVREKVNPTLVPREAPVRKPRERRDKSA